MFVLFYLLLDKISFNQSILIAIIDFIMIYNSKCVSNEMGTKNSKRNNNILIRNSIQNCDNVNILKTTEAENQKQNQFERNNINTTTKITTTKTSTTNAISSNNQTVEIKKAMSQSNNNNSVLPSVSSEMSSSSESHNISSPYKKNHNQIKSLNIELHSDSYVKYDFDFDVNNLLVRKNNRSPKNAPQIQSVDGALNTNPTHASGNNRSKGVRFSEEIFTIRYNDTSNTNLNDETKDEINDRKTTSIPPSRVLNLIRMRRMTH